MANLNFTIKNSSGLSSDQVYLYFSWPELAEGNGGGTLNDQPIQKDTWIRLSTIRSIAFTDIKGVRVYVYYGNDPNFSPNNSILAGDSPAFYKCFDKIELTFDGTEYGCADLSAIDFWSIPMNLTTTKGKEVVHKLWGIKGDNRANKILEDLHALCNPSQSSTTGKNLIQAFNDAHNPLSEGDSNRIKSPDPALIKHGSAFVRIIGPNSYPPFGTPVKVGDKQNPPGLPFIPYDTFESYFQYLIDTFGPGKNPVSPFTQLGNGKIAHLKGDFAGVGKTPTETIQKPQAYDLWATIDTHSNLTISGKSDLMDKITIQIGKWDLLNPASSYGGAPKFSLKDGIPPGDDPKMQNNIYAWILGDFIAGLNIGALGSAKKVSSVIGALGSAKEVSSVLVGEMPSQHWFKQLPAQNLLFKALWVDDQGNPIPGLKHWNHWAEVLNPVSDAYNFAYAERFSAPQINLDPDKVDALELELLPTPTLS